MSNEQRFFSDDEALSALLDGELGADEAQRLRQRVARDPALAARLAVLEKTNNTVRAAYSAVADEPLPERLVDLLRATAMTAIAAVRADNVVPLPERAPRRIFAVPASLAAGIALAVGLVLGIALGPRVLAPDAARWAADAGVVAARHRAVRRLADVAERRVARPRRGIRGYRAAHVRGGGRRLLPAHRSDRPARHDGRARVRRSRRLARGDGNVRARGRAGDYRPASGPDAALDAAIDERIDGAPLDAAAELELIERGWASAAP